MSNIDETLRPRAWAWKNEPNGEEVYSGWDSPRPTHSSIPLYDSDEVARACKVAIEKYKSNLITMIENL